MFRAIGNTQDKFLVDESHLSSLNTEDKQAYLKCISSINGASYCDLLIISAYHFIKTKISAFFKHIEIFK